ncbi:hypothetical protein AGQ63_23655 [Salmonella enterica subsp. enterica]|nr:hypothetical protein AGQ63_23655 [Salmonella enterica subsp. enterica]
MANPRVSCMITSYGCLFLADQIDANTRRALGIFGKINRVEFAVVMGSTSRPAIVYYTAGI